MIPLVVANKSKWYDSNHDFYTVNSVLLKQDGIWIVYTKQKTGVEYSCLQDAFLSRFSEQLV